MFKIRSGPEYEVELLFPLPLGEVTGFGECLGEDIGLLPLASTDNTCDRVTKIRAAILKAMTTFLIIEKVLYNKNIPLSIPIGYKELSYLTVTDLAIFLGLSTLFPNSTAI